MKGVVIAMITTPATAIVTITIPTIKADGHYTPNGMARKVKEAAPRLKELVSHAR